MLEIIVGVVLLGLLILFTVYVVLPVGSVAAVITVIAGIAAAFIISVKSFISSVAANRDPYITYVDNHKAGAGAKRNYCFGPGFHQISETIKGAYTNLSVYHGSVAAWKDRTERGRWYVDIWIRLGSMIAIFFSTVFGSVMVAVFSAILAGGIMLGMGIYLAFFSVLWALDRGLLLIRSIHGRCPHCKRKNIIPVYVCPSCGQEHHDLVPGPYGVIRRKCTCGATLPTTYFTGRYRLETRCPYCSNNMHSDGTRQYGIQMIGGIGTGKTTYLAAFWHKYREYISENSDYTYEEVPEEAFRMLENWYCKGIAEATTDLNANMYSMIHRKGNETPVQMSVYDIAGEAFDLSASSIQQQQLGYCEGFITAIDPTAPADEISNALVSFISSMESIRGKKSAKVSEIPMAVIVTKADLFRKEIGPAKTRILFRKAFRMKQLAEGDYGEFRSEICRAFLIEHGYENAVNLIEGEFDDVRFFPVSAMGHDPEPCEYEPWGVLGPVLWLMNNSRCPLKIA